MRRIKHAQPHARREQALHRNIEFGHGDQIVMHRIGKRKVRCSAVGIRSGLDPCRRTGLMTGGVMMAVLCREIVDRIAVGGDIALETPILAQNLLKQHLVGAIRRMVDGVIGAHDGVCFAFRNQGSKRGKIGVPQVVLAGFDIHLVPRRLRAAVHRVVFGRGNSA